MNLKLIMNDNKQILKIFQKKKNYKCLNKKKK